MGFLDEARGFSAQGELSLERLRGIYVQLRTLQENYIKYDQPQPAWMGNKVAELSRHITIRQHAEDEANLAQLELAEKRLMTKGEQRQQVQAQANALRRRLGLAQVIDPAPTLEPEPDVPPKAEPA